MKLFRPTGLHELQLALQRQLKAWPPRLPEQPIFYPVLNAAYAAQIAREWNSRSEGQVGYVTEFLVDDDYGSKFGRQVVGAGSHEELWVPAEELEEFNEHIQGRIRVVDAFFGEDFTGLVPKNGALKGQIARKQLETLAGQFRYSFQDFHGEVTMNREAIFLHIQFWSRLTANDLSLSAPKEEVLEAACTVWAEAFPELPLPQVA
jgi:hypothetical protein